VAPSTALYDTSTVLCTVLSGSVRNRCRAILPPPLVLALRSLAIRLPSVCSSHDALTSLTLLRSETFPMAPAHPASQHG
jgi:hypothetical protein